MRSHVPVAHVFPVPELKSQRCVVITCRVHVFSGIVTDLVFKLCQAYLSTLSALLSKNSVVRLSTGKNQELYC